MATKTTNYTAVNELYGNRTGTARKIGGMKYGGSSCRRAVYNGKILYDVWEATLSASNASISSSSATVTASLLGISSYGTDIEGSTHSIGYELDKTTIPANNTSESKTHSVTVTQRGTGQSVSVTITQAARKYSYTSYGTPSVTSTSIGTFTAEAGETKYLTVYWSQSYWDYYDNGSYTSGTTSGSSTATITSGSANNSSGAYINNGGIYCPSAGKTEYSNTRTVYTVSGYYFYANGEYGSGGTVYVSQSSNTSSTSYGALVLSISSNVSSFTSSGGTATISYSSYKPYTKTWTSGSKETGNSAISAKLSTSYGTLGTTSVSGTGTTTLTVGKDQGTGTSSTVTITAENTSKSVTMTQAKRVEKSREYAIPTTSSPTIAQAAVTGSTLTLYANWSQSYTITYDNGTTSTGSASGTNAVATVTKGTAASGVNASISGGKVVIPNAGTDWYTSARTAYTITEYTLTANNKTATVRTNIVVKQAANTRQDKGKEYTVSMGTPSVSSIANTGGSYTVTATCQERTVYLYASGSTGYSSWSGSKATVDKAYGVTSVSPTSFTGSTTITATVGENFGAARTPRVLVTASGNTSVTTSKQVQQAAVSYDFYFVDPGTIDASGATFNITLVSKVNGAFKEVIPDTVKLTEGKVNSITANSSASKYSVNVTIPANSSTTSTKSYTISAQQYDTGKTTSQTITQAKKTSSYVTGSVAISNLVSGLYVSSDGILHGFNQYPTFTITASSNGTVNACKYMFCLDFEIQTNEGQTFNARYEHQLDYIEVQAFSGTKQVQFINFPLSFSLQDLTNYMFDPYYSSISSIRVIADIERVSGNGSLMLGGSISDYTWYV